MKKREQNFDLKLRPMVFDPFLEGLAGIPSVSSEFSQILRSVSHLVEQCFGSSRSRQLAGGTMVTSTSPKLSTKRLPLIFLPAACNTPEPASVGGRQNTAYVVEALDCFESVAAAATGGVEMVRPSAGKRHRRGFCTLSCGTRSVSLVLRAKIRPFFHQKVCSVSEKRTRDLPVEQRRKAFPRTSEATIPLLTLHWLGRRMRRECSGEES